MRWKELRRYLAADKPVSEIFVLAHSMGSRLMMGSLRQMAIRNRSIEPKITEVIRTAPGR